MKRNSGILGALLIVYLTVVDAAYLGCFVDNNSNRDLNGYLNPIEMSTMTLDHCISLCKTAGFRYAGTQYSQECFCGNSYGKYGRASDSECNLPCKGNKAQMCGGISRNTIYTTDASPGSTVFPTDTTFPTPSQLCSPNPCQNGGACTQIGADFFCSCPQDFLGKRCDIPAVCFPFNPCANGRCVVDTSNRSRSACQCYQGYTGQFCEKKQDDGCFPGDATVELATGATKLISELVQGDLVKAFDAKRGQSVYSPFLFYLDRKAAVELSYVRLTLEKNAVIELTAMHLIPVQKTAEEGTAFVYAKRVQTGDYLLRENESGEMVRSEVIQIEEVMRVGAYSPLTAEGTVLVNGVSASCYAVIGSQQLADFALWPAKVVYQWFSLVPAEQHHEGIHWYANALYAGLEMVKAWTPL